MLSIDNLKADIIDLNAKYEQELLKCLNVANEAAITFRKFALQTEIGKIEDSMKVTKEEIKKLETQLTETEEVLQRLVGKAYRQLALKSHPDKLGGTATSLEIFMFNEQTAAYSVIRSKEQRDRYMVLLNHEQWVRESQSVAIPNAGTAAQDGDFFFFFVVTFSTRLSHELRDHLGELCIILCTDLVRRDALECSCQVFSHALE